MLHSRLAGSAGQRCRQPSGETSPCIDAPSPPTCKGGIVVFARLTTEPHLSESKSDLILLLRCSSCATASGRRFHDRPRQQPQTHRQQPTNNPGPAAPPQHKRATHPLIACCTSPRIRHCFADARGVGNHSDHRNRQNIDYRTAFSAGRKTVSMISRHVSRRFESSLFKSF
jgi:hypothetical protein